MYVLTITGYDLAAFDGRTEVELEGAAYLRPEESKTKIPPAKAEVLRGEGGRILAVRYTFPREVDSEPLLSDREQSVHFVCKAGDLKLRTRLEVSEMAVEKGRDL